MQSLTELRSILERLVAGTASEEDKQMLTATLQAGQIVLAGGERAIGIGGDAAGATLVSGNYNVIVDASSNAGHQTLASLFRPVFLKYYTRGLTRAVEAAHHLSEYSREVIDDVLVAILQIVRSVVAGYFEDRAELQINANIMTRIPISIYDPVIHSPLKFEEGQRLDLYQCVLTLTHWAVKSRDTLPGFAIAVHKDSTWATFGAPTTYLTGEIEVLNDTKSETELTRLLSGQPMDTAAKVRKYFLEDTEFRSFACWRIAYGETPLGVLNIQSNQINIFGDQNLHQEAIIGYIKPFCALLGLVLHARVAGDARFEAHTTN